MTSLANKCDVCSRTEQIAGVACSRVGPISMCFCVPCLQENAEAEFTFEYLYNDVGTDGEDLAPWVTTLKTYKDRRYWTWDEWKAWRKNNPPKEEIN